MNSFATSDADKMQALLTKLEREQDLKQDFVAPSSRLQLYTPHDLSLLRIADRNRFGGPGERELSSDDLIGAFSVNDLAHTHMAKNLGIPRPFYSRLQSDHPDLLDTNVNRLLREDVTRKGQSSKRLVRTMDGTVRAILSDRYHIMDHMQILDAIMPILRDVPEMRIQAAKATDKRLYLKAIFPRVQGEVAKGDVVQSGIIISNSEVGGGSTLVRRVLFRLVCENGLIQEATCRKHHLGRPSETDADYRILSTETIKAKDKAFLLELKDVVRAVANDTESFQETLRTMREANSEVLDNEPEQLVERIQKRGRLSEKEKNNILGRYLTEGERTRWGAVNAVTAAAQDQNYDRQVQMEKLGGDMLNRKTFSLN